METYCHEKAGSRIILDRTYICLHVDVKNTCFLLCAPNFDLKTHDETAYKQFNMGHMRISYGVGKSTEMSYS